MSLVGAEVSRVEDHRLLTGRGRYVDDIRLPGMVHAAFVRSPHPHASIARIDVSSAEVAPGVVCVLTGKDIVESTSPFGAALQVDGMKNPSYHALATDRVRFVGDPVALVMAETRALAEDAAELVEVEYEVFRPVVDPASALVPDGPVLFSDLDDNVIYRTASAFGDVEAAFSEADRVLRFRFEQHRHQAVPMETRGAVAAYDPGSNDLVYYAAAQSPHGLRQALAAITGHPLDRIRVIIGDVGGSFGQKGMMGREYVAVAAASLRLGRPVKWIEDRYENLVAGGQAREESVDLEAAVTAEGLILGLRARVVLDHGAYPGYPWGAPIFIKKIQLLLPGPYRVRGYAFDAVVVATNKPTYVAYRGPWEFETWARERLVDAVAHELGLDPATVRRMNMSVGNAEDHLITGPSLSGVTARDSLERALVRLDYDAFRSEQAEARSEDRYLGVGIATYIHLSPGPPDLRGQPMDNERARVRIEPDGHLVVITAQSPHGQGQETTLAQVAADEMGLPLEHVRVVYGDTSMNPFGLLGTGGSRVAWSAGAVTHVTRKLRQKVIAAASALLDVPAEQLDIVDGVVRPLGRDERGISLAELAERAYVLPAQESNPYAKSGAAVDLEVHEVYYGEDIGGSGWSGGTHVCVVEVDAGTGGVRILRWIAVEDCGRVINPAVVAGQICGGIAQGIGAVLLEHAAFDEQGQPLATTFLDYLLPTVWDVPDIEIEFIENESAGDIDFRGVGEGGTVVGPATLTNAIEDALAPFGARVTHQHLPPARVLELAGIIR